MDDPMNGCGRGTSRLNWPKGNCNSRRPVERKKTRTVAAAIAASSPDIIPSQIKMQDTEKPESNNNETKKNQELEVEKNDTASLKSLNDSDLSFAVLSKCNGENSNISMINTLNLSATESNFSEKRMSSVLRENIKLKEMFKHNNNSTRKQLNAIIGLHNEIRQICENYKQRFLEATDFIDQLEEDNSGLKATPTLNLSTEDENQANINAPTARELNLIGQLRDLSQKLKNSEENYSQSQLQLKKIENKFTVEVDNFNEVLTKFQEELKTLKEKIKTVSPSPSDLLHSVNEHCKHELETKYLIELTTVLKQNLEEKKLIVTENEDSNNYKEKLHELFKCFTKHCVDSLNVENFPGECNDIIQVFKNIEISCNEGVTDDLKLRNDELVNYKNALIDDQLQSIKDKRTFKNIQIEFLKVYSDYNNVSNKMEYLRSKHLKKKGKKGAIPKANDNNLAEIEKCLLKEKKIIDSARIKSSEERSSIEENKQNLREQRELFDAERKGELLEEKESIMNENKDIVNENLYLNREIAKLKKELSDRRDGTSLEEELKSITAQFNDVKEKLKISIKTNSELSNEITQMLDKGEEIWAYKIQVEEQQNQFQDMYEAEQNYLHQIANLSTQIQELKEENSRLRQINEQ